VWCELEILFRHGNKPQNNPSSNEWKSMFFGLFGLLFTKLYYAVLNITGVKINVCQNTTTLQTEFPWFWKTA
jgi:hypothetical protein